MTTLLLVFASNSNSIVHSTELASVYNQNYSFRIIYAQAEQTPAPETVEAARKAIVAAVADKHQGSLVGTI